MLPPTSGDSMPADKRTRITFEVSPETKQTLQRLPWGVRSEVPAVILEQLATLLSPNPRFVAGLILQGDITLAYREHSKASAKPASRRGNRANRDAQEKQDDQQETSPREAAEGESVNEPKRKTKSKSRPRTPSRARD